MPLYLVIPLPIIDIDDVILTITDITNVKDYIGSDYLIIKIKNSDSLITKLDFSILQPNTLQ